MLPHRDRVGVVDLELGRLLVVEGGPGGQQVEEHLQQVHVLPGHVGDLKDGTHPAGGGDGWDGSAGDALTSVGPPSLLTSQS